MYHAKVLEKVDNGKGYWNYLKIGVFGPGHFGDEQIGEYVRNYSSFGEATFCPFQHSNGNWYAIYSENYTSTSIMSLPDCKNIGGEPKDGNGFCPTDYYVPAYCIYHTKGKTQEEMIAKKIPEQNWKWVSQDQQDWLYDDYKKLLEINEEAWTGPFFDLNLGFVAGCYWGDDSSWKIQKLDLNKAPEGIIERIDFGYYELPNLPLSKAIDIHSDGKYCDITLAIQKHFSVKDGKIEARKDD